MREDSGSERVDAEFEIRLSREDMLVLSDGRSFDKQEVVETDDGTVLHLTVRLVGDSSE